jgi:cytochrome P450
MTTLVSYEPFVDQCTDVLCSRMSEFAATTGLVDVPKWMQFYAFDIIGTITFSQSFGLTTTGEDHLGILDAIDQSMIYGSRVGLFPELHQFLGRISSILGVAVPFDIVQNFINKQLESRRDNKHLEKEGADFLTKLLRFRALGKIEDLDLFTTLGANVAAGSDTTGIGLSAVIYYLTIHPMCMGKLRQEIEGFTSRGELSEPATFREAQRMPYLQAVIKEALRMHPATGQPLARVVPPGGAVIAGKLFPAGVWPCILTVSSKRY